MSILRAIDADLKRIGYVVETAQARRWRRRPSPVKRQPGRPRKIQPLDAA